MTEVQSQASAEKKWISHLRQHSKDAGTVEKVLSKKYAKTQTPSPLLHRKPQNLYKTFPNNFKPNNLPLPRPKLSILFSPPSLPLKFLFARNQKTGCNASSQVSRTEQISKASKELKRVALFSMGTVESKLDFQIPKALKQLLDL